MDISAISQMDTSQYTSEIKRSEASLSRFQELLASKQEEKSNQEIREACESFESYFLQLMFKEMRKTAFDEDSFIPKSNAEKIFTEMMDEESAKSAAASGGIGLADMMYRQMTQSSGITQK